MIDDEKQEKQGQQSKQELQSDRLRAEAEELLRTRPDDSSIGGRTLADIFQELQVLQIELELQNDELRIANEDLEWQRLRFAGIYDLAPVGYFILDKGGLVAEVNSAGIQLLEVSRKEIIGKPLQRYITEDSSSTVHIFFRQLSINGEKGSCRIKLKATGSKEIYAQIEGLYVDQAKQFYITVMDITESVYVRQQLDTSNERLQLAMDAALAGTWELDPETMSFEIDKFGRRFAQIAEETFKGTYASFLELIHPDERQSVDQTFRTAVNQKKEIHLSCCFYKPGLEVCYADVRGHLLQKGDGKPSIIGIMMDTTEKKLLEAETEQLRVNRQKEINAAILVAEERERQHISEALHDGIGQLIYAVKLQVSQFKDATSTKQKSEINALLDEAIRETRNISFQLSPSILVDFGLRVALEELINRLSTAAFHIQLKMSGINGRLGVSNELLIFRIVQELINNCMKHSGANKVEIFLKGNKRTVIEVLDNGRGYLKKEPEKKAMGAGLSSIRNRISVYNGKLTINNRSEGGTAVRVELDI